MWMRELMAVSGGVTVSLAVLLASSCASTGGTGDESHFQCSSQQECDAKKPGTVCKEGLCQSGAALAVVDAGADRSAPPEGTGGAPSADGPCGPCKEVLGTPHDPARGCFDRGQSVLVACSCDNDGAVVPDRCRKRRSDGSLWFMSGRYLTEQQSWTECSAEDLPGGEFSCDFAECERPPPSTCSFAEVCAGMGCDTPSLDARGCRRAACNTDAECASDERCLVVACEPATRCDTLEGSCMCSPTEPSCAPTGLCNSIETYGPGGEWLELVINERAPPCPPDGAAGTCGITWTVTPDGKVVVGSASEETVRTAPASAAQLRALVDGPELRKALAQGPDCERTPEDVYSFMELRTTKGFDGREVTGCLRGPENNIFQRVLYATGAGTTP